ncbi:MAG: hypothetical protein WCD31_07795 [Gillisia sp.]
MDKKEFSYLLENTATVTREQTGQLETLLEKYPYFQAARAVYLKGLHEQKSLHYNAELKKTAAYTVDRSVLFDFITSPLFNQDLVAQQIKKQESLLRDITVFEPQEVFGRRSIEIADAIKMKKNESDQVLDPDLFRKAEERNSPQEQKQEEEKQPTDEIRETEEIGSPLKFDPSEAHSFSEWLRLTKVKPIERDAREEEKSRKFELIDEFISKSPKIIPSKSPIKANISVDDNLPAEALMTETLARVYLEQKNYKKAIQAYKILILKNPEKSGFFADQIRAIKKIQENNTGRE